MGRGRDQNGKEKVKLSLFADNMLYIENPKNYAKQLLELTNKFSNFAGIKLIYQNLLCFYIPTTNYQKEKLNNPI